MPTSAVISLLKRQHKLISGVLFLAVIASTLAALWLFSKSHNNTRRQVYLSNHEPAKLTDHSPIWECEQIAMHDSEHRAAASEKDDINKGGVVILTPLYNAEKHLPQYFKNLCSLSFPRHQISLVLGEDSSTDQTWGLAKQYVSRLAEYFRMAQLVDISRVSSHKKWGDDTHARDLQLKRRRHLAMSRNGLLFSGLRQEDWVLWLDVDIREMPTDIIQRLIAADKDIIVPSCMYHKPITGYAAVYDRNSWRESNQSRHYLQNKPKDFLMLEGYDSALRDHLYRLSKEGDIVELDGVGGCALLIRADCHRQGLIFPPFVYDHHIETEGLAKMAKDMGFGVFGMPKLYVFHT